MTHFIETTASLWKLKVVSGQTFVYQCFHTLQLTQLLTVGFDKLQLTQLLTVVCVLRSCHALSIPFLYNIALCEHRYVLYEMVVLLGVSVYDS